MFRRVGMFSASASPLRASSTKIIKPYDIIQSSYVESVSNWKWDPFCTQFTKLVHDTSLGGLPKAKWQPSMQVFAELDIDEKILRNQQRDAKTGGYIPVYKHCKIEQVMRRAARAPEQKIFLPNCEGF